MARYLLTSAVAEGLVAIERLKLLNYNILLIPVYVAEGLVAIERLKLEESGPLPAYFCGCRGAGRD